MQLKVMYFVIGHVVSLGVAQHYMHQRYIHGHMVGSVIPSTSCTVLASHLKISFFSLHGFAICLFEMTYL